MIVKRHTHYHPDLPQPSPAPEESQKNQAPASVNPAPYSDQPITGTPVVPAVRSIHPATLNAYDSGNPASAQKGFFRQHEALNDKINRLLSQQPTYEMFVKAYQEYVASTPGAVGEIGSLFANAVSRFWTTPKQSEENPETPQDELINLHRQMLSNQAALRLADGTLSSVSKALIDKAFRYPTLAARESAFPDGSRPGVYPITVDDNTPNGARLAGSFMITATDGSRATSPHWPNGNKNINLIEMCLDKIISSQNRLRNIVQRILHFIFKFVQKWLVIFFCRKRIDDKSYSFHCHKSKKCFLIWKH